MQARVKAHTRQMTNQSPHVFSASYNPFSPVSFERVAQKSRTGSITKIHRGNYVYTDEIVDASPADRHLLKLRALQRRGVHDVVAVGKSAALLWGTWLLHLPTRVLIQRTSQGQHNGDGYARRTIPLRRPEIVDIDGIARLGRLDAALSVISTTQFTEAVMATDWLLREMEFHEGIPRAETIRLIRAGIRRLDSGAKMERANDALTFGSSLSMSAGESLSRVQMYDAGLDIPELQVRFEDSQGLIGYADYFWRYAGVIGEFDGKIKYLDPSFRNGRSADQVVFDEKVREDRLRALGFTVVRWTWSDLKQPSALERRLRAAGVS